MASPVDVMTSAETPADFGTDPTGVAQRWISEIDLAQKDHSKWLTKARKVIKQYRADMDPGDTDVLKRKFHLFWSNIETLSPATLARTPQAVVGRRWKDADPVGRLASEVLERSLNFTLDSIDFLDVAKGLLTEFLLTGRGVAWVRYVPHMAPAEPDEPDEQIGHNGGPSLDEDEGGEKTPDGEEQPDPDGSIADGAEPFEIVAWEEVVLDHVSFDDFLHNPARKWAEVRWVGRKAYMSRDELVARFGDELGKLIPLDHGSGETQGDKSSESDSQWAKATIYEIWDKPSRKAIWISKEYTAGTLDERDDPLGLKDFFPCPRPVLGTTTPDSIIPVPDITYYESQLRDIDELTRRIGLLTDALKVRGFYAAGGEQKDALANLFTGETNTMEPIDSWEAMQAAGGIEKLVAYLPIDMIATVLKGCIEARQQLINDVYQITGIADIMRGDVDPDETATATRAKGNWGSLRVRSKQKELARFSRDLLRIAGEIIATKFDPKTMAEMSNVQLLPDDAAKQQAQQQLQAQAQQAQIAAQHAQAMGQQAPPPPEPPQQLVDMLGKPTWEDLTGLLRNNTLRGFRIDVETDSTIEPNDQDEKERRIEFVTAIGELVAKLMPMLQLAPALLPMATQTILYLVRGFRAGREMEDVIEKAMDQLAQQAQQAQQHPPQQPQGPNPQVEAMKGQAAVVGAQARMMDAQTNQFQAQTDRMAAQAQAQIDQQRIGAEAQRTDLDRQADQAMHGQSLQADMQQAIVKSQERRLIKDVNAPLHIEAPTR